jgi:hypothetical protein
MRVKKHYRVLIPLFMISLLFRGFFVSDAYAYLDPGTGSMIIQGILGVLIGVGITLKVYWTKIKYGFLERKSKKD